MTIPNSSNAPVKIERSANVGYLTLSSPATLNALTPVMIDLISSGLKQHESDDSISLIIIRSDSERAFCAGGDVKRIRQLSLAGEHDDIAQFFTQEYALNLAIAQCSKPYIALINGIAMGGGLGVSVHGRFRIVTERAMLAMPESRIGFFPDVGGSYFLPRLPQRAGYWLGLTGTHVKGAQAVLSGLATHFIQSDRLPSLFESLENFSTSNQKNSDSYMQSVSACINKHTSPAIDDAFSKCMVQRAKWFSESNYNAIYADLKADANKHEDAAHMLQHLDNASPYSVATTLELFKQSIDLFSEYNINNSSQANNAACLQRCLENEFRVALEASQHPDFIEGVEAVLIDKKRSAVWQARV